MKKNWSVKTYDSREIASTRLADLAEAALKDTTIKHKEALLVVPGGSTPGQFLTELGQRELDWSAVQVLASDERWVNNDHTDSNAYLIRKCFSNGAARNANLMELYCPELTPELGAEKMSLAIGPNPNIDFCVLGMGNDMHTASLFPHSANIHQALDPNQSQAVIAMSAPNPPSARVTLSLAVLAAAKNLHVLVFGADKMKNLEAMDRRRDELVPIRSVLEASINHATIHWAP